MSRFIIPLVLFLSQTHPALSVSGNCAKNVLWDTEISQHFNQDTQKYVSETKISFSIGLHETVCFEIEGKNGMTEDPSVDGRQYFFSFEDVQTIFNYKNAYTFGLGEPKVKCLCDCPGVENHCSPSRENCKEDGNADSSCFNYYSDDQSTEGCGITSFLGTGEVCCSISVAPTSQSKYTAFEIANPVTRSLFRIEKDSPFESRFFASDLASGSPHFDGELQITFLNPGNVNPLPNGWYFGNVGSKEAYTNVEVNGLIDWDVNKLGWYKYQNGRFALSQTAVKNAFSSFVLNCDDSAMNVSFYSEVNMTYAKALEEFYASTISKAERDDNERTLSLQYFDFSKINVMITVSGEKRVVLRYNMPSFLDFNAAAMFDKHSNRFLNVTVISGKGTLYGSLRVGVEESNFDFILPSEGGQAINYTNYVQVTHWCNETMMADLCFHAGDNQEMCKVIDCSEEALMHFVLPESAIDYEVIQKPNIFGMETWSKYMNPLEWFNGIDNWQEGVIMLISIVLYLTLISILAKLFTCFKCGADLCSKIAGFSCCFCCKKKKTTDKKDKRKGRKENYYEEIEFDAPRAKSGRRKGSKLPNSPTFSVKSSRSNISQRHRKVTRNRGLGNPGYVGSSFKSAQSSFRSARTSFRRASQRSRRLMEQTLSYSDSELIKEPEQGSTVILNTFIEEFGKRKYELFQTMWNEYGMPPQDICPEEDGGMRPHYNIRDEEVCLDIDSDERLDQRNMFTDPHKHKRQQSSQQSRRPHKDRALSPSSRSERGFSPAGRSKPQYSSMPHRHKAKKHSRDHDRSFSPRGSEDHGKLTIGKRKGEKLQKTLDHRNHERDLPRKWKEEDKNGNTEDSSSTSSLQESDPIKNTSVYENESVKLVREPLSDSNKHDKESDKSDMRCPEVDMSGIVRSDNDCSDLAVV